MPPSARRAQEHVVVSIPRSTLASLASAASLALALCVLCTAGASAQVIGPGHEQTILALFAPHVLGQEVAGGYALWNVSLESSYVEVMLRAEDGRETTLTLRHASTAPEGAPHTTSFAVTTSGASDEGAELAQGALLAAIERNDQGGFWQVAASTVHLGSRRPHWTQIDGLLAIALVYLLALLLAWRLLIDAPRWMGPALLGIVVAGVLVRLALAPPTFLGAWPWTRLYPHVRVVVEGRGIAMLSDYVGHSFYVTDVMMWTNFAYAAAMPLVLFAHGTYLLRDPRAGLAASFAVAFLPQHIRFSRSEDGFVASLVLTSLAFALIHGWLRDASRRVRWLLLLALPFVLYPGYLLRPLNILFIVVYAFAIVGLHGESAPRARRAAALATVLAVGAAALFAFLEQNAEIAQEATSRWDWPLNALRVLVSPTLLVLSDPMRTPLPLMVLAVIGGVLAWRAGERRMVLFLCAWLVVFVVAHAVVVQESMEPRYHLHLVVPFLLLAATAVPRIEARWRPWLWAAAGIMVVSPWIHRGFVEDVGYTEMHEYDFVHRARDVVPERCTVLEYTGGSRNAREIRFARIGELAGAGTRFDVIGVSSNGRISGGHPPLDEILRSPPECLYLYEGLACSTWRSPGETYAHECTELRARLGAELVLEASAPVRLYDSANEGDEPLEVDRVPFRLSLARPRSAD